MSAEWPAAAWSRPGLKKVPRGLDTSAEKTNAPDPFFMIPEYRHDLQQTSGEAAHTQKVAV
jgi:hypothetical protein